jgi:hypothetical protein
MSTQRVLGKNTLAFAAGLIIALTSFGCAAPAAPNAVNAFQLAPANGVNFTAPEGDGNEGKIDKKWDRTSTTCTSGDISKDVLDYSFYINNTTGYIVLNLKDQNSPTYTGSFATIPVTYIYTDTQVQVVRDMTKPIFCKDAGKQDCSTKDPVILGFQYPKFTYTLSADKQTLKVEMDRDSMCATLGSGSKAEFVASF